MHTVAMGASAMRVELHRHLRGLIAHIMKVLIEQRNQKTQLVPKMKSDVMRHPHSMLPTMFRTRLSPSLPERRLSCSAAWSL